MKLCLRIIMAIIVTTATIYAQNGEVTPNENLIAEGLPKIPITLAEEAGRYTEIRSARFLSWHPFKRELLILTRFGNTDQVHQVKAPIGDRRQLTFFKEPISSAYYGPKRDNYFIFNKDVGGNEFAQNYRYDIASGKVTLLTDGKSRNSNGVFSDSGHWLAYTSTRRNGKDVDLYIMDPTDPTTDRKIAEVEGGGWSILDWTPDEQQLLVREYISINETYLWLFDVASGNKTLITPKGGTEKVAYSFAQFDREGKGIYLITDKDSEFLRLAYLELATKRLSYLNNQVNWDVESFALSNDKKSLAYVTNENGIGVLHLFDTTTNKELPTPQLPVGVILNLNWHSNGKDLGFTLTSARSPADAYSVDITTGKVQRWTESETGGLNTTDFAEPSLIRWSSFDGRMISGFLYRPPARYTGKRPVFIVIHGGPEGQARPRFLEQYNYFIEELGVTVIFPNVRGSSGFGKTFLKLDNGFLREDSVKDIGALFDWIATQPDLDTDRIMVSGGSYGGYMSLAVSTHYSARIRGAIDIVGISNFATFLEKTEGYRRDLRRVEYGDERDAKMREFMLKTAPANNAHKITKPLFVVQGKNDPRVPRNESEQMVATVRKNGGTVWYLLAQDEGHGFSKKDNEDFLLYATIMFMKEYLFR
ncbi:MAG: prolyl oligopeptidase family serine peptidase [Acidobacteriota bacterium]